MNKQDVIIIGAGAAGLMCAIEAGKRGRSVLVIDHANKAGKKILMSGGGRCNFTNKEVGVDNYISHNPHFCRSALSRYTPDHFIDLVQKHRIPFHEKTRGQLFCDRKSKDIVHMLLKEVEDAGVTVKLSTSVTAIEPLDGGGYCVIGEHGSTYTESLVIASGGLSIPTMGASPFGYQIAEQFGIHVWPTRAGLVPFTLQPHDKELLAALSGVALPCQISCNSQHFDEDMLFTHRGLSGPAVLQISSYWQPGGVVSIDLSPDQSLFALMKQLKREKGRKLLKNILFSYFPKSVVHAWLQDDELELWVSDCSDRLLQSIADRFRCWAVKPSGTEGYRTAEVTLGGVDCNALSSQSLQVKDMPGLYFIGEVVDVTGWLGGYNFQWAWASGHAAGQYV